MLVAGAACTCRKYIVKNAGIRAKAVKVRLGFMGRGKVVLPDGRILIKRFSKTERCSASSSAWSCGRGLFVGVVGGATWGERAPFG